MATIACDLIDDDQSPTVYEQIIDSNARIKQSMEQSLTSDYTRKSSSSPYKIEGPKIVRKKPDVIEVL